MLAQRLDVMRQERDARSKTARKKTPAKVPAMAGPPSPAMELETDFSFDDSSFDDSGVVELPGDGAPSEVSSSGGGVGRRGGNPRRSKNKKKKRKNRK